jgi:signal transduction histidine kinase
MASANTTENAIENATEKVKQTGPTLDETINHVSSEQNVIDILSSDKLSAEKLQFVKDYIRAQQMTINQNKQVIKTLNHDLRNAVNPLVGFSRLCVSEYVNTVKNPDEETDKLYALLMTLNKISDIVVERFDKYNKWSNASIDSKMNPKIYAISELLESNKSELTQKAALKGIKIEYANEFELLDSECGKLQAFADKDLVDIVITNLVGNSIKFTPSGKNIYLTAEEHDDLYVRVTVHDEGVGISQDIKKKVFENKGLTTLGTNGEKGTGCGLDGCRSYVEQMGGKIWVDEEQDYIGTKMHFTLPRYSPVEMMKKE